jgi:beta-lactamase regulating signal transducer with metallopeptidase domain
VVALVAGRYFAKSASNAALLLGLAPWALGLLLLVASFLPSLGTGVVAIQHAALEGPSLGTLTLSPVAILVGVWAIGTFVLVFRFVRDLRAVMALLGRATGTAPRAAELLANAARVVGLKRLPELRETTELATAALVGFRAPVLLIPAQAREWTDEELFGVLCHELEHARRNDWLMLMVERVVTAIFWINPLVHLVRRSASAAREIAADDAAVRAGAAASVYAGRLISVARDLRKAPKMAVSVAFADEGSVEGRVRALFESRDRSLTSRASALRWILMAAPLLLALSAVEPFTCLPSPPQSTTTCE